MGMRVSLCLFCLLLRLIPSYWVALSGLNMKDVCLVLLYLFFFWSCLTVNFKRKCRGWRGRIWRREELEQGLRGMEGGETMAGIYLYERRIYFKI